MNDSTGLLNRFIRPAAALAMGGVIIAWAIAAGGAPPTDRHAAAREIAKGNTRMMKIPATLAPKPQPCPADTIVPNMPHWFLPTARPGHEAPGAKAPRLMGLHIRPTILADEYATETYGVQQYPDLPPTLPLAWASFPDPSELSVPVAWSGPDGDSAKLSSDPTSGQSRIAVLDGRPLLRQTHAAFLRLTIPDPFGLIDAVKLEIEAMPPDNDLPTVPKTPPDPTMPITSRKR